MGKLFDWMAQRNIPHQNVNWDHQFGSECFRVDKSKLVFKDKTVLRGFTKKLNIKKCVPQLCRIRQLFHKTANKMVSLLVRQLEIFEVNPETLVLGAYFHTTRAHRFWTCCEYENPHSEIRI